jgi:2Fe-2S ferredoxin
MEMPGVVYLNGKEDGTRIEIGIGETVMSGAVRAGIDGIQAVCGGSCSCATCHVYVEQPWFDQLPKASEDEANMLEFAAHVQENSRLSCQIKMTEELDGLVVRMPPGQY